MGRKPISVPAGTRFGRLIVLHEAERHGPSRLRQFRCKCDCGNVSVVGLSGLRSGATKSCGCLRKQLSAERLRTHGLSGTAEYNVWFNMMARCFNPNHPQFPHYGGRGISVCDRWRESPGVFLEDMGPRPSAAHSIDRVDNDGNYEPGNCHWATRREKGNNIQHNRLLTHQGKTQCVTAWAEEVGISLYALQQRVHRGWSVERALTEPVPKRLKATA